MATKKSTETKTSTTKASAKPKGANAKGAKPKTTKTTTVKKSVRTKKTVAAKTVRAPKAKATTAPIVMTSEERAHLIAVSAYLRAESRGFGQGGEVEDWLVAEQEVDARLTSPTA